MKKNMFYIILVGLISILGLSYSIFIIDSKKVTTSELLVGNLTYGLNIYEDNSYTPLSGTAVTIPANTSKEYYITIFSTNPVSSKFTLAYNNSNVTVEVSSRSGWNPSGLINEYSSNAFSKTIKIKVTNNTSSSQTVDFKAYGGYSFNSVASINLGNGYYSVINTYNEAFALEGELLTDIVKDDTNCIPTASEPCLYGGDTTVNYFKFDEDSNDVYRVVGNYLVNGEVLTKIIGPASTDDNINSTTTLSSADYQKIGGSSSYLGSNYASLSVYYLNSDVAVTGNGTSSSKYILGVSADINIVYTYGGSSTNLLSYNTYLQGVGTIYENSISCEGASATIDSSGIAEFTVTQIPEVCTIDYSIALNKEISLSNLRNADKVTLNHTYEGNATNTSLDDYISNYRANTISCSSGTSASITNNGNVTFAAVSLPMTCTVDFMESTPTYSVESPVDESSYKFALNSSGYFESNNKSVSNSAALAKVTITNYKSTDITATITLINYGEACCDYGIFSNLDTQLSTSYTVDSESLIYQNFKNNSSSSTKTITYQIPKGTHYIYVKYRKDSSDSSGNDSLQFKINF